MIFIISTSKEFINNAETFFWGRENFLKIKNCLPQSVTEIISISSGLIYFNKSVQKDKYAVQLNVKSVQVTKDYLKLKCEIEKNTEYPSYQIKDALKKYFKIKSILDLPFCCAVDKTNFFEMLGNNELLSKISNLENTNDWKGIYQLALNFTPVEKSTIWYDAALLSKFSFASAKLAECTENLKRKFTDKTKREEYLKEKRQLRKTTLKLRSRCIELEPENASYYSNYAYSLYQSVTELNTPGGRRDGNILIESEAALEYLEKALILEPNRVADLYRKGFILSQLLFNNTLFKNTEESELPAKSEEAKKYLLTGIEAFERAVYCFENLIDNEFAVKRYKKYYIKSLYHLAQNYLQLSKSDFNIKNLLFKSDVFDNSKTTNEERLNLLVKADYYIDKCINQDYNRNKKEVFLIDKSDIDNFIAGVYKAYTKASVNLFTFITTQKIKYSDTAKEYFQRALETSFPKEIQNQNKIFVLEKTALLNISEKKFEAAISTLEPLYRSKKLLPAYAAHTLTIAYLLNNSIEKASEIIETYLKLNDKIFNKKFLQLKEICLKSYTYSRTVIK
ncbi:MAG TPA: hypothetical protein PKD03_05655 [Ignavibacteriaceae bacterium]|nr:hypothetical protein [Ignavibacteriaceae bacterium]